ncbi:MAG: cation diffusion facilitator family transporter, partial [Actinomycetota bacterium]
RTPTRVRQRRALWIALVANAGFLVVEAAGGLAFHSLALLADAAHMLSDVAGLGIALIAQRLLERPASIRHTFGLQRAEVLGAQANGVLLLGVAAWIVYEAAMRAVRPVTVTGPGLLAVASLGLAVNVGSAVLLARSRGRSLNMAGAYLHMVLDSIGSLGAIVAGIAVIGWQADVADPIISIAIAALVIWSAWRLLSDTAHVLMEGTPRGLDPREVEEALKDQRHVEAVHALHLWSLASDTSALSAHVVLGGLSTLHEAQLTGERLKIMLAERFGVQQATLELECHDCDALGSTGRHAFECELERPGR